MDDSMGMNKMTKSKRERTNGNTKGSTQTHREKYMHSLQHDKKLAKQSIIAECHTHKNAANARGSYYIR